MAKHALQKLNHFQTLFVNHIQSKDVKRCSLSTMFLRKPMELLANSMIKVTLNLNGYTFKSLLPRKVVNQYLTIKMKK